MLMFELSSLINKCTTISYLVVVCSADFVIATVDSGQSDQPRELAVRNAGIGAVSVRRHQFRLFCVRFSQLLKPHV
jgi:hypothetical protein